MKLRTRMAVLLALAAAAVAGTTALALRLGQAPGAAALIALAVTLPLCLLFAVLATRRVEQFLAALAGLVRGLGEGDFSLSLAARGDAETRALAQAFNALGDTLRGERQNLHQRELLLETLIQAAPQALVLTAADARIAYANGTACRLLASGHPLEGLLWPAALEGVPAALREGLLGGEDKLVTVAGVGEPEVFQLLHRPFTLNGRPHVLHLAQPLTRELARQELATWKNLIRIVSHELNNSLAPISSLAHSGRLLAAQGRTEPLDEVFATIQERSARLREFLDGYAAFAKLPQPRPQAVEWESFLRGLRGAERAFRIDTPLPAEPAWFDPAQMQQVLINLLKNAHESGSSAAEVALCIEAQGGGQLLRVQDRGTGMSADTLASALLPFYTTKQTGTGLGLALCREIVEAHGGRLGLFNRERGGLEVRIWLPRPVLARTV